MLQDIITDMQACDIEIAKTLGEIGRIVMFDLSQTEADDLLAMPKQVIDAARRSFPLQGERLVVPLVAQEGQEKFILNIRRSKIETKLTYQTRTHQSTILARLDFGAEHRNPDGKLVGSPHLHVYREGHGDRWAYELPHRDYINFDKATSIGGWFDGFLAFCNINPENLITTRLI